MVQVGKKTYLARGFTRIAYLHSVEKVAVFALCPTRADTVLVDKVPQKPYLIWKCGDKVAKTKVRSALFTFSICTRSSGEECLHIM